jgi:aryl hydrocarbon receptor nuclear translocator
LDLLPRLRNRAQIFEDAGKFYAVVHCSGYVKSSPPIGIQSIGPQSTNACLVAIARLQLMSVNSQICNSTQFTLRADKEGFITYVDQKAQELLHKPISEILGKHLWMLVHSMDEQLVVDAFKSMTQKNQQQVKVEILFIEKIITSPSESFLQIALSK